MANVSEENDFIWTGNWADAIAFLDRVDYSVPFLGSPAIYLRDCQGNGVRILHVANDFLDSSQHCDVGDKIRWYASTRSFGIVRTP